MTPPTAFDGLEPALVWTRFAELTRIPRPSKHEDEARAHVLAWASRYGFATRVDTAGNVVVGVTATSGRERAPIVVLQSHLDMVCERAPDSPFDPREGRIEVVRDGDWIRAEGTTLGADNGIGVAAALTAAEDAGVRHGPLELLFTVSEEQGLDGAKALDPSIVQGRVLLNLDGSSDGALTIGCAGSVHTFIRVALLPPEPVSVGETALSVTLGGARGGHSGGDVARGRVNAVKALGRVLAAASRVRPLRLARLDGGVSRNAIPRDAGAAIVVPAQSAPVVRDAIDVELEALRLQHAGTDDELRISVEPTAIAEAAGTASSARALDLLATLPTGVLAMSPAVPSAVETSTGVNVATTDAGVLTLASMTRSASPFALEEVVTSLEALARLARADVEVVRSYPPWQPDPDSALLRTAREVFSRLFGHDPALEIVHGGLECAVIGGKLPGVDMLAVGPTIEGPHAPGERLGIASTERFYRLLSALLDELSS